MALAKRHAIRDKRNLDIFLNSNPTKNKGVGWIGGPPMLPGDPYISILGGF